MRLLADWCKIRVNQNVAVSGLLKTFLPIVLGSALAYALAIFYRDYPVKQAVPAIFVLVLVLIAHFSGRLASLVTAFLGGLIFAVYLFEPYGHLSVGSATDRVILSCFALVALVLACASPQAKHNQQRLSGGAARIERYQHWIALGIALLALLAGLLALFRPC